MPDTPSAAQMVVSAQVTEHRFEFSEGAPCSLARKLIAEGKADRSDRLMMLRDGKPALSGNVGWFADRTLIENAKVGPLYAKWRPFPDVRRRPGTASSLPEVE
jgi:hypothetical protein